ncbi:MAG: cytochrome c [Amphritea sp.]
MKTNTVLAVALSVLVTVAAPLAVAHGGASGVVKERMDLMDSMKDAMKSLKAIFKGDVAYDPEAVRQAALVIRDSAGEKMTSLFPQGSLHKPSEAKSEIWQEWDRFDLLAKRLQVISQGLHDAADNQSAVGQGHMGEGSMMGTDSMMGSSSMMGGQMMGNSAAGSESMMGGMSEMMDSPEHYAQMPADRVFKMLTDNCSSCHTRYRLEDK